MSPVGPPRETRHKTLSAYYTHLYTLESYLALLTNHSTLIVEGDLPAYRDLLQNTICAVDEVPQLLATGSTVEVLGSQQEAVDRILSELGRSSGWGDTKNTLLAGNRYAIELPINPARPNAATRHANSPTTVLRSLPWRILRARIGDVAFRHLLIHSSNFLLVGNNCFMQLSGCPIYELYDHKKVGKPDLNSKKRKQGDADVPRGNKKRKHKVTPEDVELSVDSGRKATRKSKESPAEVLIPRQRIFYGQPTRRPNGQLFAGLPPHHVLNKVTPKRSVPIPDDHSCLCLLQSIFPNFFGIRYDSHPTKTTMLSNAGLPKSNAGRKRLLGMMGMARELVARHRSIDYAKLFRRMMERSRDPTASTLKPISHAQVCRFVSAVFKQILPPTISGSEENTAILLNHAKRFIKAKQHEPVNLHNLIQGISVNNVSWISSPSDQRVPAAEANKRRSLALEFVRWIFEGYLIHLIKNSFYLTETAETRYETVYFAHDDWAVATRPHFQHLEEELLEELDSNERYFALQGPLGVSAVRLIPKPNGFRPIVNLGRRIKQNNLPGIPIPGSARSLTANQVLRSVHQVLTFEKDRKRDQLGASLFGTNEIFLPLQDLKQDFFKLHGRIPKLYFAKMDIRAAFDTIKQNKVLEIISNILDKDYDYSLMLYSLLLPPASKASQGSARRLFKSRAVLNDGSSLGFGDHARDIAKPLRNAVVVDLMRRRPVTKDSCMDLLRQHIQRNTWQVGNRFFRQKNGIPQGSKISSLLCSIFYAALENEYLSFLQSRPGTRLLRYIDDFLLVTDDLGVAKQFVRRMNEGWKEEWGAEVARAKTVLNFEFIDHCKTGVENTWFGSDWFPYCGFLINMRTMEVSMDYPRILSAPARQSFAIRNTRHQGSAFIGWFSRQLENRNHVAYLDTAHNDVTTVHNNVFLNFALTTMKIPYYFAGSARVEGQQASMIFDSLILAADYTYVAGRARVKHASRSQDTERNHYAVKKRDFMFLAASAMFKVLSKKAATFKLICDLLDKYLAQRERRKLAEELSSTVERGWAAVKDAKF